jgi:hypothetical protein
MRSTRTRLIAASVVAISAVTLSACSTDASGSTDSSTSSDLAIGSTDLAAAGCPANVVIQTDWNPEAEHGHLYELLGDDYTVDASNKLVSGPLMSKGEYTGVNVEIRAGGPAIGFQSVSSQMYTDTDITLGYVVSDEAMQVSDSLPTTAVFAPLDKSPLMIMWDPATYPDAETIPDVVADGAIVRYFDGYTYMEYLKSTGVIPAEQVDGGYDGTPASFVAAAGKDAQQGFASAEPYIYQNEVSSWGKPVKYQLIHDLGYQPYISAMAVRSGELEDLSPCLTALVPVLQQAEVDYYADPAAANSLILDLVDQYDTGWVYTQGVADYSVKTQLELGLASNGDNDTIGDFDTDRVGDLLTKVAPIFDKLGTPVKSGLTVDDLVTNEFIDTSIGLDK